MHVFITIRSADDCMSCQMRYSLKKEKKKKRRGGNRQMRLRFDLGENGMGPSPATTTVPHLKLSATPLITSEHGSRTQALAATSDVRWRRRSPPTAFLHLTRMPCTFFTFSFHIFTPRRKKYLGIYHFIVGTFQAF